MPRRDSRILTKIQQQTLDAIRGHIQKHGESPTLGELREVLKVGSHQTIVDRVDALVKKGFIRRKPHSWRNLELTEKAAPQNKKTIQVPLVASAGADNMSVFAQEEYGQYIHIDQSLLQGQRDIVAIRVIGNSMREAGIMDGSYVITVIFDGYSPKNGDLVVAVIDDVAVVKRYYKFKHGIELRPDSDDPTYSPILVADTSARVKIIGQVVDVFSPEEDDSDDVTFEPLQEF